MHARLEAADVYLPVHSSDKNPTLSREIPSTGDQCQPSNPIHHFGFDTRDLILLRARRENPSPAR